MSFLHYLISAKRKSADVARERLQIIVAHERSANQVPAHAPDFLPDLQREIIGVLAKYFPVDPMQVKVNLEQSGEYNILELNVPITINGFDTQADANA